MAKGGGGGGRGGRFGRFGASYGSRADAAAAYPKGSRVRIGKTEYEVTGVQPGREWRGTQTPQLRAVGERGRVGMDSVLNIGRMFNNGVNPRIQRL